MASGDLQPGAVAADESFVVTSGSPHFAGATQLGRLARILPNGTTAWNNMVNAVTPPVIGGNGLIFVGTQSAPINANGSGAIKAYNPASGNLIWSASVSGLPNDLLVGDDGAVYAGTGSFSNGKVYAISQSDGSIRKVITNVPGAWEIVLRAGLLYASGTSITAIPVDAVNYDLNSPWAVRFHDNQRTGNRQTPILTPPRESGATNIDPQAYAGNYILYNTDTNTNLGTFSGTQSLNLVAGNYLFDNSNQVGASAFNFSVNQFGQVSNVSNPNAAQAVGNTLRLNNATLNIEPGGYTGRYKFFASNSFYTGSQSFVVVPGLLYGVDNGTGRGGAAAQSYFYFAVGANGAVSNIDVPAAAVGDGNTLRFNNATLIVEPNGYTGNYNLSSHYTIAPYISGRQSFIMIPGLLYAFDAGTGSYEQTFKLDANGSPTNISPSGFAAGINNILVLANVSVRVDPTNYGGNYLLNDRIFSGIQDLVLIPEVRFYVAVNNSVGYFMPTQTSVTPPSVTLNSGAQTFNFYIVPADNIAPTTIAALNQAANAAGWHNSNVNVSLSATDNTNGSGVREIVYSASGAQTIASTTASGASANLSITAEGITTVSYFARDNAGNTETVQTLTVRIDKTAPVLTSSATANGNPYTAGTWTNLNVVVSFDCTDTLSGTANVTQPVTLSNEGANQSANGTCNDVAGNSANTSFANIKIDKTAPTISITAPTSGNYLLNQTVTVNFTCSDSLSGVSSCNGTTANGGLLNTASIGAKTFTVSSTDNAGNSASPTTVNYTVNFGLVILFDQTRAHKSGSTVPIKIRLVDANGANVSSAATVVRAVNVIQIGSQASTILEDAGNSNPDFDFRYDQSLGGYIFNLKTTGYGTGTYRLNFIAGNSPTIYSVQFQVRQ